MSIRKLPNMLFRRHNIILQKDTCSWPRPWKARWCSKFKGILQWDTKLLWGAILINLIIHQISHLRSLCRISRASVQKTDLQDKNQGIRQIKVKDLNIMLLNPAIRRSWQRSTFLLKQEREWIRMKSCTALRVQKGRIRWWIG